MTCKTHHDMQDLPAAGALWFVTGRDDDKARNSIVAWRERYGSDRERWRSIGMWTVVRWIWS